MSGTNKEITTEETFLPIFARVLIILLGVSFVVYTAETLLVPVDIAYWPQFAAFITIIALAIVSWVAFEVYRGRKAARTMIFLITLISVPFVGLDLTGAAEISSLSLAMRGIEALIWLACSALCLTPVLKKWLVN